jgi:phospholipid/cholesterol/gamma-HCH transport system ATP-binding protein
MDTPNTDTPLIEFQKVTKRFNDHTVLDQVDLKIYGGDVTTIIGKSGTGKSVLLKHIIGLITPDEGTILVRGQPIEKMSKRERYKYFRQISYMFQNNALFDSMTVFENIALPLRQTTRMSEETIERKVKTRMEQTELTEAADKYPSELSGGMQKRVALSRALVTDPKIVLFDEPTTGQDVIRRNAILSMITQYQQLFGFTAVLISHDIPDVFFISNRIIAIDEGRIIFQGTPEQFDEFEHPFMDEFVHSIEELEEHLTGIQSKRQFKIRNQVGLSRKRPQESYAVALFTLEGFDQLCEVLGHTRGQEVLNALGRYINKHFGVVGGFSTRQSKNQFATFLPFSDLQEAERLLKDFGAGLQGEGLGVIQAGARITPEICYEFAILGGVAEGKAGDEEIDVISKEAEARQKEIARFRCEKRR